MKKIDAIKRVDGMLRVLRLMPEDTEILGIQADESTRRDWIHVYRGIAQMADIFGKPIKTTEFCRGWERMGIMVDGILIYELMEMEDPQK